jgi:hypothetical protein
MLSEDYALPSPQCCMRERDASSLFEELLCVNSGLIDARHPPAEFGLGAIDVIGNINQLGREDVIHVSCSAMRVRVFSTSSGTLGLSSSAAFFKMLMSKPTYQMQWTVSLIAIADKLWSELITRLESGFERELARYP